MSITCDNASTNDAMMASLTNGLVSFPGAVHHVRCLAHIVNLVIKIILKQFDVQKKKKDGGEGKNSGEDNKLEEGEGEMDPGGYEEEEEEDMDAIECKLGREINILNAAEQVKPVQQVLVKVHSHHMPFALAKWVYILTCYHHVDTTACLGLTHAVENHLEHVAHAATYPQPTSTKTQLRKLVYAVKNSSTVIRPRWREILTDLSSSNSRLSVCMMPRDVRTWWNSTYDMLKFSYTYRDAIDKLTSECTLKLRDYKLTEPEWEIVKQLQDSLRVCPSSHNP